MSEMAGFGRALHLHFQRISNVRTASMAIFSLSETAHWRNLDTRHHLHPFTDHKALAAEGGSRIITRGEGVWLWDSEGHRILDAMAGLWCVNVGYGRPVSTMSCTPIPGRKPMTRPCAWCAITGT
jgi:hypothetical protein